MREGEPIPPLYSAGIMTFVRSQRIGIVEASDLGFYVAVVLEREAYLHPLPMQNIPLLGLIQAALLGTLAVLLLWFQWRRPLRSVRYSVVKRTVRNLVFSFPGFALARLGMIPVPLAVSVWAHDQGLGLLNWIPVPGWLAAVLGFLLMDWAYYWWHVATHRVPLLWRFHHVHHTDLDMDMSTSVRFHFGEIIVSVPFRVSAVVLLGIPAKALIVYEIVFGCAALFHHSNWRLPLRLERILNMVFVTPRMHGIHHSIVRRETDSNWGTVFSWWDKLHGTLRRGIPQNEITIGLPAYRSAKELTLLKLMALPFKKPRPWELPDGSVPERNAEGDERNTMEA